VKNTLGLLKKARLIKNKQQLQFIRQVEEAVMKGEAKFSEVL
jgi:hypothetical protein